MRLPEISRRLRMFTLLYGLIIFFWLTPEEDSIETVTLLGAGAAFFVVTWQTLRLRGGHWINLRIVPIILAILGAAIGLLTGGTTAFLMLIKNAIHGHEHLDYVPELMLAILERMPVWSFAGALLGVGLGLAWAALHDVSLEG